MRQDAECRSAVGQKDDETKWLFDNIAEEAAKSHANPARPFSGWHDLDDRLGIRQHLLDSGFRSIEKQNQAEISRLRYTAPLQLTI